MFVTRMRRTTAGIVGAIVAGVALTGCVLVPGFPLDQPVSLSVVDGAPVIAWCGPDGEVRNVAVYYSAPDREDGDLVSVGEGSLDITHGDLLPLSSSDAWEVTTYRDPADTDGVLEVTVGVSAVRDLDDGYVAKEVQVTGLFTFGSAQELANWPEGEWKWADGTVSEDKCGMGSPG